ncbi:MAG: hypothetical protein ACI8RZ_002155 [Myxococcota bacterium]|jgi:hypothetical protein
MPSTIKMIAAGLFVGRADPIRDTMSYRAEPQQQGVIWQGFSQTWGYNHRLNSLGDWVGQLVCGERCSVVMGHSAASGSGTDTARWDSQATAVSAAGVRFRQGVVTFDIDERHAEGRHLRTTASIEFADIEEHTVSTALLGGLDIFAINNADRLQELTLSLDSPQPTASGGLTVQARLDLRVDCDSLECDGFLTRKFNHKVQYRIEVPVLLLTGDPGALVVESHSLDTAYTWGNHRREDAPIERETVRLSAQLPASTMTQTAGLTGFSLQLDRDHHFSGWSSRIDLVDRMLHGELLFQQWNRGSVKSPLSFINRIEARASLSAAILSFSDACTDTIQVDGEQHWRADGRPARSEEAVTTTTREILQSCLVSAASGR